MTQVQTGADVHRRLIDAQRRAAAKLEELRAAAETFFEQDESLRSRRDETLRRLAEHYLPELTPEAIAATWVEVRPAAREVRMRNQATIQRVGEELAEAQTTLRAAEDALTAADDALNAATDRQQIAADRTTAHLQADPQFVELTGRVAAAESALQRAEENRLQILREAEEKLPAYDDRLFQYLYDRGFGTPRYGSKGVTRRIDRWLADYIGFRDAKRGYEFLSRTPETMAKVIAEDREALDQVMGQVESMRDAAAARAGLPEAIATRQAAEARRDDAVQLVEQSQLRVNELNQQHRRAVDVRGDAYDEAVSEFREVLKRIDIDELQRTARATPEITDDQIVATLRGVDRDIETLADQQKQHKQSVAAAESVHSALGRLVQRFRAARYDTGRSVFSDRLKLDSRLDQIQSESDVDELWQAIRRMHDQGPGLAERAADIADNPMAVVLAGAMASAAGEAVRRRTDRAVQRRKDN